MPNFASNELSDDLVPESKTLWQASDRASLLTEYNHHFAKWEHRMLEIGGLWQSSEAGSENETG